MYLITMLALLISGIVCLTTTIVLSYLYLLFKFKSNIDERFILFNYNFYIYSDSKNELGMRLTKGDIK